MALSFTKKAGGVASATPDEVKEASSGGLSSNKSSTGGMSFLKKGAAAKEAVAEAEAKAELAKAEAGKLWRFYIPDDEERTITFLDGDLDAEGMLDAPVWWEHSIQFNGNWEQFACTAEEDQSQPCPLCEGGSKPYLATALTVIDHTPHKIKKGPNAGKTISNQRKLFVCKRQTAAQLTKIAVKRGGLAGCTFEASRVGDKAAAVGSQFDFVSKAESWEQFCADQEIKIEDVQPAKYQEEIRYRTPEELIELGVAKAASKGKGNSYSSGGGFNKSSLENQL